MAECLICFKEFEDQESFSEEECEGLIRVLCKALRVKMAKKYFWKHPPLCPDCVGVVKKLREIEEEVLRLEKAFKERTDTLKRRLKKGAETNEAKMTSEDEKISNFRRQVTGIKGRTRDKAQTKNEEILKSVTSRHFVRIKPRDGEMSAGPPKIPDGLRRSNRKTAKRLFNDELENDNEDKVVNIIASKHTPIKTDAPNFDDFENGYIPEFFKTDTGDDDADTRLKSEVEIKEEQFSESDVDFALESRTTNKRTRAGKERKCKKSKSRRLQIQTGPSKRRRVSRSTAEESVCEESDYESEIYESRDDFSTEDEESKDRSPCRKWKNDRKKGRLWYDGVEVYAVGEGYKCSKCDTIIDGAHNYKTRGKMKKHIIVKHLVKYSCVICNKITSCQKYLDQHIRMVHEKSVMIPCDICGKPFTSINAMRRHKWNHQSEEEKQKAVAAGKKQYGNGKLRLLVCETCGKLCKGPYNLRRHEETHVDQKERQKHMCSFCGSIYSAPESLRSHIKLAHENNNQLQWLQCPHCPKKYPQPGLLDKHMRAHTGAKPFVCEECGAGFSQPNLLKVHILKHKNIRPHKCSDCDMAFYRVYHLRRHREVYHESANPPTKKQPYRSENGTRKTPQKRKKIVITSKTAMLEPSSVTVDASLSEDTAENRTNITIEDEMPQQHISLGSEDVQQNFDFVRSEGSYSFTSYSFPASQDS